MPSYPEPRRDEVQRRNSASKAKDVYTDSESCSWKVLNNKKLLMSGELYLPWCRTCYVQIQCLLRRGHPRLHQSIQGELWVVVHGWEKALSEDGFTELWGTDYRRVTLRRGGWHISRGWWTWPCETWRKLYLTRGTSGQRILPEATVTVAYKLWFQSSGPWIIGVVHCLLMVMDFLFFNSNLCLQGLDQITGLSGDETFPSLCSWSGLKLPYSGAISFSFRPVFSFLQMKPSPYKHLPYLSTPPRPINPQIGRISVWVTWKIVWTLYCPQVSVFGGTY